MYGQDTACGYASRALGNTILALQNNGTKYPDGTLRTMLFRMIPVCIWHNMRGCRGWARRCKAKTTTTAKESRDKTNRPLWRGRSAAATDRYDVLLVFRLAEIHSRALDKATSRIESIALLT